MGIITQLIINHRPSRWLIICGHRPDSKAAPYSANVVCVLHYFLCPVNGSSNSNSIYSAILSSFNWFCMYSCILFALVNRKLYHCFDGTSLFTDFDEHARLTSMQPRLDSEELLFIENVISENIGKTLLLYVMKRMIRTTN